MNSVKKALEAQVTISDEIYYTDSTICLSWIKAFDKEYKTFVQNRLNEIRKLSNVEKWNYVQTKSNPADMLTKFSPNLFKPNSFWWSGPEFLKKKNIQNDFINSENNEVFVDEELKTTAVHVATSNFSISNIIDIEKFNSYLKLIRVTAWVTRYVNNLKAKTFNKSEFIKEKFLSAEEIKQSERLWIIDNQKVLKNSKHFELLTKQLNIKLENSIYRCYGRLQNAPLSFESRSPVILSKEHKLAKLIVLYVHSTSNHVGVKQTLNEFRNRFWITQGRSFIKKVLIDCYICRKYKGKPYPYPEFAPLPEFRLNDSRPFAVVGVDLCGPIFVKNVYFDGYGGMFKTWVVLYTCAASRGIVLDVVKDQSAETFIKSFCRFVSRRGCPDEVVSDNGSNFVATETQNFVGSFGVEWHLNLAKAPWYGGFFERLIGLVKSQLKIQLGNARLTIDELLTILLEIERILNNRPITYDYPTDLDKCLTPNHLLYGRRLESHSYRDNCEFNPIDQVTYSKHLTNILNHFWNRWRTEYLAELRETHKITKKSMSSKFIISQNDVVIIKDSTISRPFWRLAVVEKLIVSKDNKVRGAVVRLPNSNVLERPINMLYPIEATKLNNTKNLYTPLEKDNAAEVDFVVNKKDNLVKAIVVKPIVKAIVVDDSINVESERKIGESEDTKGEQQISRRQPRRKAAELADLKIKHCKSDI